jgi:tetratricopeptide (TPR) repeat protein
MPPSLEALLASRLDLLETGELSVLQRAAVEGRDFTHETVVHLVRSDEAEAVRGHLQALAQKGLIRERPAERAFRFRHVLIRDAAYASLPKEHRGELHERFGRWLEAQPTGSDELVGFHLEQAHLYRTELGMDGEASLQLAAEAGERLSAAGLRAAKGGDMPAAADLLTRASSLVDPAEVARRDLLTELGLVRWRRGEVAEAQANFERAIEAAASERDRRGELRARTELSHLRLRRAEEGASEELLSLASEAIPVLEQAGDDRALGRIWFALATVSGGFFCQYRQSSEAAERALGYFRRSDWPLLPCLQELAAGLYYGPTPVEEAINGCRALLQEADRGGTAQILVYLAGLEGMAARFDSARALLSEVRQIYDDLAWTVNVFTMLAPVAADTEFLAGNFTEAETLLAESCGVLEAWGLLGQVATQATQLAEALYGQGRYEEAVRWSETAEACAASYDTGAQFLWRGVRGKALARQGAVDRGVRLAREAVELAAATDSVSQRAHVLLSYAEVLQLDGRAADAVEAIEEATGLLQEKGNIAAARGAAALLVGVAGA